MESKFYITTPVYYVNASPHIGHSYTTIAADTLARYMRKAIGDKRVYFLTGTDEHGQKIQKAAQEAKLSPQDFADRTVDKFKGLWKALGISYDGFIRTTEGRHIKAVQDVLQALYKSGDIYIDKYKGLYCVPCETFWLESQAKDGLCPDCARALESLAEDNYFLNLEKHHAWLLQYIRDNPSFIRPESRRNEVLSFLELNKLEPLCISRPKERLSWGIPLPFSPEHVTYVWFDALVNYISAVGAFDGRGQYHSDWWPAELQLIGKDILRQHAVYWPVILHALNIELPKSIFAHGWWLVGQDKMSKSRGNVINPLEMVKKYGIDAYRYFLMRDVPFGLDGNFSEEAMIKRYNSDLANDLGNLVYRTLTMTEKYFNGRIPEAKLKAGSGKAGQILSKAGNLKGLVCSGLSGENFSLVLESIWELINLANKYVEESKPWNLAKEGKTVQLEEFIRLLIDVINAVAEELYPFMPDACVSISEQIGKTSISKGKPLFPRIDVS